MRQASQKNYKCKITSNTAKIKIKFDYYQFLLYLCTTVSEMNYTPNTQEQNDKKARLITKFAFFTIT